MRKTIWITLLTLATVTGWFAPAPEAQAIDPVTIAILAPAAMRMAETAQPYVIQGIAGGAQGLAQMGMAAFKILYIPWGVVQCTLGLPLGGAFLRRGEHLRRRGGSFRAAFSHDHVSGPVFRSRRVISAGADAFSLYREMK